MAVAGLTASKDPTGPKGPKKSCLWAMQPLMLRRAGRGGVATVPTITGTDLRGGTTANEPQRRPLGTVRPEWLRSLALAIPKYGESPQITCRAVM